MDSPRKNTFHRVWRKVSQIPPGQVTTYGWLAKLLGLRDARVVGWALHSNNNPKVPCHRVVNAQGFLAENYSFGGDQEQRLKLQEEGVTFNNHQVDLEKHLWRGEKES